jgi:hypothetical protein
VGKAGQLVKNPFWREVDRLEEDLAPYARTFSVRARRFAMAFAPAFILALIAVPNLTLGLALTTALSVAVTVLGELDPSIPWGVIVQKLDKARWRDPVVTPPAQGNKL